MIFGVQLAACSNSQFPDSLIKLDSLPIWRHLHLFLLLNIQLFCMHASGILYIFFQFLNRKKEGGGFFLLQQVFLGPQFVVDNVIYLNKCIFKIPNSILICKEMVFCYQNCPDLQWQKIVLGLVIFFLKFEAEGREFANILRSLKNLIKQLGN